jgi:sugar lactone lactonase YvrE
LKNTEANAFFNQSIFYPKGKSMTKHVLFVALIFCFLNVSANDEFRIKREEVFTFKTEPKVIADNEFAKISFETDGFCDVTVVIEDDNGKIFRHLASGVLGDNPPPQFQPKTKSQVVIWDYKDDAGFYPKNTEKLNVRVSLGLKPQFEKTLFWSAEKRINREAATILQSCKKGVLTFEGEGRDQLKLYSHSGEYIKTIYPFANKDINKVKALTFQSFPQDGKTLPIKFGNKHFATFLKTGKNVINMDKYERAATAIVVHGDTVGVIGGKLGFLTLGDDFENVAVDGPSLTVKVMSQGKEITIFPGSAALSPDGKWLYLAGYQGYYGVKKIAFDKTGVLGHFAGQPDGKRGTDNNSFDGAASVACDSTGRVYVADYCNNRVQVYSGSGEFLKSIPIQSPHMMQVNPSNGDIYVSSWLSMHSNNAKDGSDPVLYHLGNFDNPVVKSKYPLPFVDYAKNVFMNEGNWSIYNVQINFFEKEPIFWILPGRIGTNSEKWMGRGLKVNAGEASSLKLYTADGKSLKKIYDFGPKVTTSVKRFLPPVIARQRLFVNPQNEKLYIAEGDSGVMKSFQELVEVDPETGAVNIIRIPVVSEDLCFDHNGLVYFRTGFEVIRYDPKTWKEIPFDYGVEQDKIGFEGHGPTSISAIKLPAISLPGQFHLGGMAINHKLNLIVSCYNSTFNLGPEQFVEGINIKKNGKNAYMPQMYPGRVNYCQIHMWDRQGRMLKEDVFPGIGITDGIAIDNDDNIFSLVDGARYINGKPFFDPCSETLIKVKPNQAKILSDSKRVEIPLASSSKPKRDPDIHSGSVDKAWVEGADWFYGGVGFAGFSVGYAPACACWNARFSLDYLKRSFAPEITHYSVAVLDANGNLILRIGQYGNIEDGVPLKKEGGPNNPVSIGGDEVALFHAAYVATTTDKKLFIADAGNARILSVKLGYHAQKINQIKLPNFDK